MRKSTRNGPPTPEEFQRQLADFMRQHFPNMSAQFTANATSKAEAPAPPAEEKEDSDSVYEFDKKPRDVKAHLDRFVIKQDEAKKALAVAICDHYHQVRLARAGQGQANYTKQNIILVGPTGVGKTYLIRSIAELIGVPFVKGDATKFSETGYVGGDVEDLVRDLVRKANGDVERAQYGIIYIDEIDKIASAPTNNRDVSGRGVQTNLLKLMEETDVPARSQQDMAGQIQAILDMQRGRKGANVINTRHILFIVSGAFPGLDKVVSKRMRQATIGFASRELPDRDDEALKQVQTQDFIDFGFEPEFIGRLPVRVVCQQLNAEDMFQILKTSEGSIIRQYEQSFAAYGIEAEFKDEALRRIAEFAAHENTGARGLMTVCERALREFKYELPSSNIRKFVVDAGLIENPRAGLDALLEAERAMMAHSARKFVDEFAEDFSKTHGLKLKFTEPAADLLVKLAMEQNVSIRAFCETRFKDYQFGLKLVSQNTRQTDFTIDREAVEAPDKVLSEWVVASYRASHTPAVEAAENPPS